jgi:anthranilate phosphoribosyltransferase
MKEILKYLFEHRTLTRENAQNVLNNIAEGKYNDAEIASFISVYLMRAITVDELSGFRDALLNHCKRIDLSEFNTIDVCGTGGDEKNTFNISTLTAFVIAGAGYHVAKHGNYSVSSSCGSSNVLEYFGYQFTAEENKLKKQIEKAGICFLHAPLFNPAMKNVVPVRKSLRIKTFFNMLGPMVNPAFPNNQMIGVFSLDVARLYNYIYQQSGKNYSIVHSLDGYDEISLTSPFKIYTQKSEQIIYPEDLGFKNNKAEDIFGGNSVEKAASLFMSILQGEGNDHQNNTVLANAMFGIKCLEPKKDMKTCYHIAKESLIEGKALNAFDTLIKI